MRTLCFTVIILSSCDFVLFFIFIYLFIYLFCKEWIKSSIERSLENLFLKGNTSTQIKGEMDAVYRDTVPSFTKVKFLAAEFKMGLPAWLMIKDQDSQKLQRLMKTLQKFTKWCWAIVESR